MKEYGIGGGEGFKELKPVLFPHTTLNPIVPALPAQPHNVLSSFFSLI
jgi:hypothetical protein